MYIYIYITVRLEPIAGYAHLARVKTGSVTNVMVRYVLTKGYVSVESTHENCSVLRYFFYQ